MNHGQGLSRVTTMWARTKLDAVVLEPVWQQSTAVLQLDLETERGPCLCQDIWFRVERDLQDSSLESRQTCIHSIADNGFSFELWISPLTGRSCALHAADSLTSFSSWLSSFEGNDSDAKQLSSSRARGRTSVASMSSVSTSRPLPLVKRTMPSCVDVSSEFSASW
jgi:hypothetical protein